MMPNSFYRPRDLNEALQILKENGDRTSILAGGTDLLIKMRGRKVTPDTVLDISAIDELRGIEQKEGFLKIGALTTPTEICEHEGLKVWAPLLMDACAALGSFQIRNRATIGGNLGNASPAGDTIPPLYVLEAEIQLTDRRRDRWVPIAEFFRGPGATVRHDDEIITAIRFRPLDPAEKSFFSKLGQRRAVTIAKVSAAGALTLEDGKVVSCQLALGAVAPTVIRLPEAEKLLIGNALTKTLIDRVGESAKEFCCPITDIRSNENYRRKIAKVLIVRGLRSIHKDNQT